MVGQWTKNAQRFAGQAWTVGSLMTDAEVLDAIGAVVDVNYAMAHPELWQITHDLECTPILWPKDRLHGLRELIEKKRNEEALWYTPPPETAYESALFGLKRMKIALGRQFKGIEWQQRQVGRLSKPLLSKPKDAMVAAEFYKAHATLANQLIGFYTSAMDWKARRDFKNQHPDYFVQIDALGAPSSEELEWINVPKGFEKDLYFAMRQIPPGEYNPPSIFSRIGSWFAAPINFFAKLRDERKILAARRQAKLDLMDASQFPGFEWLLDPLTQETTSAAEEMINELARIRLYQDPERQVELTGELKRHIQIRANDVRLIALKQSILDDLEKAHIGKENLQENKAELERNIRNLNDKIDELFDNIKTQEEVIRLKIDSINIAEEKMAAPAEDLPDEAIQDIRAKQKLSIESFKKELDESRGEKQRLSSLLKEERRKLLKEQDKLENYNVKYERLSQPFNHSAIEKNVDKLKGCNPKAYRFLTEFLQKTNELNQLTDEKIDLIIQVTTHPHFNYLPAQTKELICFNILFEKSQYKEYYEDFALPMLEFAKPGMTLFDEKEKQYWFDVLAEMQDPKTLQAKMELIKTKNILPKLEEIAKEMLDSKTNVKWEEAIKNNYLFKNEDDSKEHQNFNKKLQENLMFKQLRNELSLQLYNLGHIPVSVQEQIPDMLDKELNAFLGALTEARTKLSSEKPDEMSNLSEHFSTLYEAKMASLLVEQGFKTNQENEAGIKKLDNEIMKMGTRFQLNRIHTILTPFIEENEAYQALPNVLKSEILSKIFIASTLKGLIEEWKLIPSKINYFTEINNNTVFNELDPEFQQAIIIHFDKYKNAEQFHKNYEFINDVLDKIQQIQSHSHYNGISKSTEYEYYHRLLHATPNTLESSMAQINSEMNEIGQTWGATFRKWGAWGKEIVTTTAEISSDFTDEMYGMGDFDNLDPSPTPVSETTSESETKERNLVNQLQSIMGKDAKQAEEIIEALHKASGKTLLSNESTFPGYQPHSAQSQKLKERPQEDTTPPKKNKSSGGFDPGRT